ncbi:MAG: type I 3-dehydroquinate dehydratase [Clostridia bacterium]|nr:type I 3-dehydroquinate dehydratase [Clostridia bacterium]
MKPTFLQYEKPLLTVMIQTPNPDHAVQRIRKSLAAGGDAFGLQMESFPAEYHNDEFYRSLLAEMQGRPVYVTNYRSGKNKGRTDEDLAEELLHMADLGGTLFDVMNDYFDPTPGEFSENPVAVEKQKKLIADLHAKGAEVLMSCHVLKFISAEEVLKIALAQQERGADIVKIVTGAETEEQQVENLRICLLLKETLSVPFLFLSGGKSRILRRIGPKLGCCMYLCVCEHDAHTTHAQPLLASVKALRDEMGL